MRPARGGRRTPPRARRPRNRSADAPSTRWLRSATITVARIGLALVILAIFVFGVFPTGRYLEHRSELDRAHRELAELRAENDRLQARVDRLESDAEIERVARAEYDMIFPGEESYAVLPPGGS